jgi:hypothetical protein
VLTRFAIDNNEIKSLVGKKDDPKGKTSFEAQPRKKDVELIENKDVGDTK